MVARRRRVDITEIQFVFAVVVVIVVREIGGLTDQSRRRPKVRHGRSLIQDVTCGEALFIFGALSKCSSVRFESSQNSVQE